MLTFLKRTAKNTVMETSDRKKAVYFQIDNGPLHPIDELTDSMVANSGGLVANIPTDVLPEPLLMPTMNESQDEQPNLDEPLPLPVMNFDKAKNQKAAKNVDNGLPEPLPLPTM